MRSTRASRPPRTAEQPNNSDAAYEEAVRCLARQPQSRAMLAVRLQRTGYEAAAIESALERAEAAGYLNDRQYAESLVRRRRGTRGSAMIAQELRASGIDQRAAEPVLASLDPEVEFNNALTVGRKLVADRRLVGGEALLAYLAPKLARRGFANGVVYRVCRLLAGEWQAAGLFDESLEQN